MDQVPSHREALARTLAAGDSVLYHAGGVTEGGLYDQPVESLHGSLRKASKTRGAFQSEEAALKLIYLAISKVVNQWHTLQNWKPALNYLERT